MKFLLSFFLCLIVSFVFAQNNNDTTVKSRQELRLLKKLEKDTTIPAIVNKVQAYTLSLNRASYVTRRSFDISGVMKQLPSIETSFKAFKNDLDKTDTKLNLRAINTLMILVNDQVNKLTNWQNTLSDYYEKLDSSNQKVETILNDDVLDVVVPDTALASAINDLEKRAKKIDSEQNELQAKLNLLRNKLSLELLVANDLLIDINRRSNTIKRTIWQKDEPFLFKATSSDYDTGFLKISTDSIIKANDVLLSYLKNFSWNTIIICFIITIMLLIWSSRNYNKIKKLPHAGELLQPACFLRRSKIISWIAVLFTCNIFFYQDPPRVFILANELIALMSAIYLIYPFMTSLAKRLIIVFVMLWVYLMFDDLMLDTSFIHRWLLFISATAITVLTLYLLKRKSPIFKGLNEEPAMIRFLLLITLIQAILSVGFNTTGCVAIAKIFGASAIHSLLFSICLKIINHVLLETIYLQKETVNESLRFFEFLDFSKIQKQMNRFLVFLTGLLWVIVLFKNLTIFNSFYKILFEFLNAPRAIGNMMFSFKSIGIFALVIWISAIISQMMTFFLNREQLNSEKRSRLGSVSLLFRIAIWTIGFMVAIGAAGIPMEKVSIMIGALGVGIGFGLQNIVNNLVSGIILAFERPIQIGDSIEVGNKAGTVKEIGIRSSKISNFDGAEIIVPNGDLLSQHLTNWTLKDRHKRMEIIVGVSYNTNLKRVQELILAVLNKYETIMTEPAPGIFVHQFNTCSVDFRILFWVHDIGDATSTRSNVMVDIYELFAKSGIEIPHSKMDVYLKQ